MIILTLAALIPGTGVLLFARAVRRRRAQLGEPAVDPLCEALYRHLILCYQRSGNRIEAIATYERLRTVLAARLKTVPSAETQALYASIKAG